MVKKYLETSRDVLHRRVEGHAGGIWKMKCNLEKKLITFIVKLTFDSKICRRLNGPADPVGDLAGVPALVPSGDLGEHQRPILANGGAAVLGGKK